MEFVFRNVKPFLGSDDKEFQKGGPYYSTSAPVIKGVEEAQKALKLSNEDRLSLVVDLQPSDDEEDEEEEANGMDFDRKQLSKENVSLF